MVHFLKEIVSNKFLIGGAPVSFEVLDGNIGVIALEENEANKPLIAELTKNCGRYGISKISEGDYQQKKTAPQIFGRSHQRSQRNEKLRVVHTRQPTNPFGRQVGQAAPGGAAAGGEMKPPAVVPQAPAEPPVPESQPEAANGEAQVAMAVPPKFTPATRRISRRAEGAPSETVSTSAPGE